MCGIYGVYSQTLSNKEKNDAHMLGLLNMERGTDSSGVLVGYRDKGVQLRYLRALSSAAQLHEIDSVNKLIYDSPSVFMVLGHNRAATVGAINLENAHPIHEHSIVGVHNGTIGSIQKEAERAGISDSRLLFRMINSIGLEKALDELKWWDPFAIAFTNSKEKTLNFVRNQGRPLFFMFSKNGRTFWWSSEARALQFIAQGTSVNEFMEPVELDEGKLMQVELGTLKAKEVLLKKKEQEIFPPRKFGSNANRSVSDGTEWDPAFKSSELDGPPFDPNTPTILDYQNQEARSRNIISPAEAAARLEAQRAAEHRNPSIIHLPPPKFKGERATYYTGYKGKPSKLHDAKKILHKGCFWCKKQAELEDIVWFFNYKDFICTDECYEDPLCKEYLEKFSLWKGECHYESVSRV